MATPLLFKREKVTSNPNPQSRRMKLRGQRPSEFSLQNNNETSSPGSLDSCPDVDESRCCKIEDAKTKFGTLIFGLLLMAAGAALLYFGFRPNPEAQGGKTSSDNKLLLTSGFICSLLGTFCFVVSILMFKDVPCLYSDNPYQIDEDEKV